MRTVGLVLVDLDPTLLAAHPAPAAALDELASTPPFPLADRRWVVGRPDDVATVLGSSMTRVVPPAVEPRLETLVAGMARFSDGDAHTRLRRDVDDVVATLDPGSLRLDALATTQRHLDPLDVVDLVALARWVPSVVLASTLEIADPEGAVATAHALVDHLSSGHDDAEPSLRMATCDHAASLQPAHLALLFQATDATASMIVDQLVERPVASIVLTTRVTTAPILVGGATIPKDALVLVTLGAAARSDPGHAFGAGVHHCPGQAIAMALASGVIEAVRAWTGVDTLSAPQGWQRRPNLRLPIEMSILTSRSPLGAHQWTSKPGPIRPEVTQILGNP